MSNSIKLKLCKSKIKNVLSLKFAKAKIVQKKKCLPAAKPWLDLLQPVVSATTGGAGGDGGGDAATTTAKKTGRRRRRPATERKMRGGGGRS